MAIIVKIPDPCVKFLKLICFNWHCLSTHYTVIFLTCVYRLFNFFIIEMVRKRFLSTNFVTQNLK